MAEKFYGPWSLVVVSATVPNPGEFWERFIIAGSDASDDVYPGIPGASIAVSGQVWTLTLEYRVPGTQTWFTVSAQKTGTYSAQAGLLVYLRANDTDILTNMVIMCRNLDPELNPFQPSVNPFDFTVSDEAMARYRRLRSNVRDRSTRHRP